MSARVAHLTAAFHAEENPARRARLFDLVTKAVALDRVLPASARREDGRLRFDDANNFYNVLR